MPSEDVQVWRSGVRRTSSSIGDFPTLRYTYEAPAAIVLKQHDRWFKVRLSDGVGWIHA